MNAVADAGKHDPAVLRIGILGGGIVGQLAAFALTQSLQESLQIPHRIELFEHLGPPQPDRQFNANYAARNIVLSNVSVKYLQSLGIWHHLEALLAPIQSLIVRRQLGRAASAIRAADEGVGALGYVAELDLLVQKFAELVASQPNCHCYYGVRPQALRAVKGGYRLRANHIDSKSAAWAELNAEHQFDFLLIADGQKSWGCRQLGIGAMQTNYDQSALVCRLELQQALGATSYELFVPGGALTILPMQQSQHTSDQCPAGLVWIGAPAAQQRLSELHSNSFINELQQLLPEALVVTDVGERACYPLSQAVRTERCRPNLLVIGNAAQTMHPIAAQSFNLAVRDIRELCKLWQYPGRSSKVSINTWQGFAEQRNQDARQVGLFVRALNQNFIEARTGWLTEQLQDLAIRSFESIPGVKPALAHFALGGRQLGSRREVVRW